ncbi:hypothetical protein D3C72_2321010 [compost metagenome]
MLEGRWTVLLIEEMPCPGEAVAGQWQRQQQQESALGNGQGKNENHQGGPDKVQSSASAVAVFVEVIGVKLGEAVESSDVFHDCNLCEGRYGQADMQRAA